MLCAITDCREERELRIKLLLAYLMTNTKTIFAIMTLAAVLTTVPLLHQEADGIAFVPTTIEEVSFEHSVSFEYDMNSGYAQAISPIDGTTSESKILASYSPIANLQSIFWEFPQTVNLMYDFTEYSSYADFTLRSVEYRIISDGNGQIDVSSNQGMGYQVHRGQTSDSGMVYVTVVGTYHWSPLGTP